MILTIHLIKSIQKQWDTRASKENGFPEFTVSHPTNSRALPIQTIPCVKSDAEMPALWHRDQQGPEHLHLSPNSLSHSNAVSSLGGSWEPVWTSRTFASAMWIEKQFPQLFPLSYSREQRGRQEPMADTIPGTGQKASCDGPIPTRLYSINSSPFQTNKHLSYVWLCPLPFAPPFRFQSPEILNTFQCVNAGSTGLTCLCGVGWVSL